MHTCICIQTHTYTQLHKYTGCRPISRVYFHEFYEYLNEPKGFADMPLSADLRRLILMTRIRISVVDRRARSPPMNPTPARTIPVAGKFGKTRSSGPSETTRFRRVTYRKLTFSVSRLQAELLSFLCPSFTARVLFFRRGLTAFASRLRLLLRDHEDSRVATRR